MTISAPSAYGNVGALGYGAVPPKRRAAWPYVLASIVILIIYVFGAFFWSIKSWQPKATAFAERFHSEYNSGQYDQIYDEADTRFKNAVTKEEFAKLLTTVDTKLGKAKQTSQVNIFMNKTTNGTFLTVNFDSTFDQDSAKEIFTLVTVGDEVKLVGYRVNSKALLEK